MPGIFDSSWAEKILKCLKRHYEILPVVIGTMGKTAILDNFLENEIHIRDEKPSDFIAKVSRHVDGIVLATYTSSAKKSHAYCWHLINTSKFGKTFVEIDANNGIVTPWTSGSLQLASFISNKTGLEVENPPSFTKTISSSKGKKYRRVLAVDVGDHILINKLVVGKATSEEVILVEENGVLNGIIGVDVKSDGLKKLHKTGRINVEKISVESTSSLRFTWKEPRIVNETKKRGVAFIDHAGYNVYRLASETEAAITIGDDTTSIVGDILYRFQTPILGIVDGDKDSLLKNLHLSKDSIVILVRNDDEVGCRIYEKIFNKKNKISKKFDGVKDEILELIKNEILEIKKIE